MSSLAEQLRLHLEHEQLWGTRELTPTYSLSAKPERSLTVLVLCDEADRQPGPGLELFAKMISAIGLSLDQCQMAPVPKTLSELEFLAYDSTIAILGFGPAALALLGKLSSDSASNKLADIPTFSTFGPAHLLCFPEDKREAWGQLQELQKVLSS